MNYHIILLKHAILIVFIVGYPKARSQNRFLIKKGGEILFSYHFNSVYGTFFFADTATLAEFIIYVQTELISFF